MRCDKNMARNYLRKIAIAICLCCAFTMVNFQQLKAQILGTETQVIKWLSASGLRSWFTNMGTEGEYFRRDRTTYLNVDQIDGLCWPNEFNIRMKGVKAAKAMWIGTTNFADPVSKPTSPYSYKVVCIGKDAVHTGTEIFADELSLLGQFDHPKVYVDNGGLVSASARDYDDILDETDTKLVSDRVMLNRFHTSIGVSVTRKVLAFSQQYHNNYYIYEYTFKNTGIIDESGQKKINVPLTGVRFYFQTRLAFSGVSYTGIGLTNVGGWAAPTTPWGKNAITDVFGQDAGHALLAPNNFRANISYYGAMATSPFGIAGDLGYPGPSATNVTCLAGYQFAGTAVLHADKAANDTTDDITQPTTTMYVGADNPIDRNLQATQYNTNLMAQKYTQYIAGGHPGQTQAEQIGKDANGWPTINPANTFGTDAGGYMSAQGFGPYDINPGDSVRIVVAEAVAGISWEKSCEVGRNWFAVRNGTSNPQLVLPAGYKNGAVTTDANEYKNAWVFSGKDSLFQTFRRARANYQSGYKIPQPPLPPSTFTVASGGDGINISWTEPLDPSRLAGYKLYRCEGRTDTTYDLILECGKDVKSYIDKNAKRGFNYYYYIQSKDDGSTNDIEPGVPLVSSRYYTMTNSPAALSRQAGRAINTISNTFTLQGDDSTKNFIFPNGISLADSTGTVARGISVSINGVRQIATLYTIVKNPPTFSTPLNSDTLKFYKAPQRGTIEVKIMAPTGERDYRLSEIRIVPNPWNINARNIQYGTRDTRTMDKLQFFNLPPKCLIKIYTEVGDLVATIDHKSTGGDEAWYLKTSSNQIVVSGLYIAYFEVTEDDAAGHYRKGDNIFKKFVIIR